MKRKSEKNERKAGRSAGLIRLVTTALLIMALAVTYALPAGLAGDGAISYAAAKSKGFAKANRVTTVTAPASRAAVTKAPSTEGTSVVLMDMDSGEVVYQKNASKVREPASVTKILNLMVVLDCLELDQEVTISDDVETSGSVVGLLPGEVITVKDLIYGMMLCSGNDAAEELAKAAAGDVDSFCKLMNKKARECGCTDTNYKNPNGLNEVTGKDNHTTALDLARMTRVAMNNATFRKVVSTSYYTMSATNLSGERSIRNSNHCLWDDTTIGLVNGEWEHIKYDACTGVKTGYTSDAGCCYVGTAEKGGSRYVAVILNAPMDPSRFSDAVALWNYGFENFHSYTAVKKEGFTYEEKVRRGALHSVQLGLEEDLVLTMAKKYKCSSKTITTEVVTDEEKATAPIKEGDKLGRLVAYDKKGKEVGSRDLYALTDVEKGGILSYIGIADEDVPIFIAILIGILAVIVLILWLIRRFNLWRRARGRLAPAGRRKKAHARASGSRSREDREDREEREERRSRSEGSGRPSRSERSGRRSRDDQARSRQEARSRSKLRKRRAKRKRKSSKRRV